jgi:hypothetical protein
LEVYVKAAGVEDIKEHLDVIRAGGCEQPLIFFYR